MLYHFCLTGKQLFMLLLKLVTNPCEARVELHIFFKNSFKGEMFKLRNISIFRKFNIGLKFTQVDTIVMISVLREMPQIQVLVKSQTQKILL